MRPATSVPHTETMLPNWYQVTNTGCGAPGVDGKAANRRRVRRSIRALAAGASRCLTGHTLVRCSSAVRASARSWWVAPQSSTASTASSRQPDEDDAPAVALIGGEAGIGKTRLVRELLARFPDDARHRRPSRSWLAGASVLARARHRRPAHRPRRPARASSPTLSSPWRTGSSAAAGDLRRRREGRAHHRRLRRPPLG